MSAYDNAGGFHHSCRPMLSFTDLGEVATVPSDRSKSFRLELAR